MDMPFPGPKEQTHPRWCRCPAGTWPVFAASFTAAADALRGACYSVVRDKCTYDSASAARATMGNTATGW